MLFKFSLDNIRRTAMLPLLIIWLLLTVVGAQEDAREFKVPLEVLKFLEKDEQAIALETADLNGDGAADFILVTEKKTTTEAMPDDKENDRRSLLILTGGAGGELQMSQRSEQVVYCRSCGGAFGDPFAGIKIRRGRFTVMNYGGSAWRWSESYQFDYSRRDRTWQLVQVKSESFNALEPEKVKTTILTPKHFGKIDISDFDPARLPKSD